MEIALTILSLVIMSVACFYSGMNIAKIRLFKQGRLVSNQWMEIRRLTKNSGLDPDEFETFLLALIMATRHKINLDKIMKKGVNEETTGPEFDRVMEIINLVEAYAKTENLSNWHLGMAAWLVLTAQAQQAKKKFEAVSAKNRFGPNSLFGPGAFSKKG